MAKIKVCDFCLNESRGLFNSPEQLADGHAICKNCKKIIQSYDLPVKYDLFQILVTADSYQREMIMGDYLENHKAADTLARHFPMPAIIMHNGEHCANVCDATIRVAKAMIPVEKAPVNIADITRKNISNLYDAPGESGAEVVSGRLYETEAAVYFMSEHFINCHRLSQLIHEDPDTEHLHIMEGSSTFTYTMKHVDLFFLRERLFQLTTAAAANKKTNLVYLTSDNTMTVTPGIYNVPKNLSSGTYWVSALKDKGMCVKDATGHVRDVRSGRVHLDVGSTLEVSGEYQLRIQKHDDDK